jgi:hypothetical protein
LLKSNDQFRDRDDKKAVPSSQVRGRVPLLRTVLKLDAEGPFWLMILGGMAG